jgi:hypothetical protein
VEDFLPTINTPCKGGRAALRTAHSNARSRSWL